MQETLEESVKGESGLCYTDQHLISPVRLQGSSSRCYLSSYASSYFLQLSIVKRSQGGLAAELESNAFICTVSLRIAVHVGAMVSIWANECVWDATAESRAAKGWVDQRFADWLAGSWPFPALFATVTAGWKKEPKAPAVRPLTCTSTPLTTPACSRPLTLFHGPFPSASS